MNTFMNTFRKYKKNWEIFPISPNFTGFRPFLDGNSEKYLVNSNDHIFYKNGWKKLLDPTNESYRVHLFINMNGDI